MSPVVPEEIKKIYLIFHEAGFQLYLVGGSVRNMLLYKDEALKKIRKEEVSEVG